MFEGIKEKALQKLINSQISKYGSVRLYDCDFSKNKLNGELHLNGEDEAVEFKCKYKIVNDGDESYIKISGLKISREWMQKIADDFIIGNEHEIDGRLSSIIEVLL